MAKLKWDRARKINPEPVSRSKAERAADRLLEKNDEYTPPPAKRQRGTTPGKFHGSDPYRIRSHKQLHNPDKGLSARRWPEIPKEERERLKKAFKEASLARLYGKKPEEE